MTNRHQAGDIPPHQPQNRSTATSKLRRGKRHGPVGLEPLASEVDWLPPSVLRDRNEKVGWNQSTGLNSDWAKGIAAIMGYNVDSLAFDGRTVDSDPSLSAAFKEAEEFALEVGHGVDIYLHFGCLGCSAPITYLEEAIGRRCGTGTSPLPPEELRSLAEAARWPQPDAIPDDQLWAYWTARKFLEVCVAQGLGIYSA